MKEVLAEEKSDSDLAIIRVDSPEKANEINFQGSPSIKINGKDWEGRNDIPGLRCRLYMINGKLTGVPTREFIREKLSFLKQED